MILTLDSDLDEMTLFPISEITYPFGVSTKDRNLPKH